MYDTRSFVCTAVVLIYHLYPYLAYREPNRPGHSSCGANVFLRAVLRGSLDSMRAFRVGPSSP